MVSAIRDFLRLEAAGGIVLALAALAALAIANSPFEPYYDRFLEMPGAIIVGPLNIQKPLLLWLNDGWMAVFFLLVGMEIKRELVEGELSDLKAASLPVIGAIGGMAVPAGIYLAINGGYGAAAHGWAIPTATDIAFALGVMNLLGRSVPASLKVLLTAIAIIDDLGAIVIIALFYTSDLSLLSLGLAAVALAGLAFLNRTGVRSLAPYMLIGIVLWVCVLKSGVHATLAGVATGLAVPLAADKNRHSPLRHLEHALHPWVAFLVLPAFAFANAGVPLGGISFSALLAPVPLGILLGLFLGKQIGVFGALWLAIKAGLGRLPEGANWVQLYGLALLCGIGFTMSLFIGGLAFDDADHAVQVRVGVLAGSILSAALGAAMLKGARRR